MGILWNEIKKILNWRILLLLFIANIIFYFLFIEYPATTDTRKSKGVQYRIGAEMAHKYGGDMEEEDFVDFKKTYERQVEEAENYLQSRTEFVAAGIRSYEDFVNIDWDNEEQRTLHNRVMFEEKVDIFWELQERRLLIEDWHDNRETWLEFVSENTTNAKQKARLDALKKAGHYQVYPGIVLGNYKDFVSSVAIAVILSVVLVISPVFIEDRSKQLLDLQYTTQKGRNLYKTKTAAGLISAFIVIATLLIVYFGVYVLNINNYVLHRNNLSVFFQVPIHTFIGTYYWYDPTFLQYIALTVMTIWVLGFVFVLVAMSFSSMMSNYVALIGIQIPPVFGMLHYGLSYLLGKMIDIEVAQWVTPVSYSLIVAISITFMVLMWKREKKRDIVI